MKALLASGSHNGTVRLWGVPPECGDMTMAEDTQQLGKYRILEELGKGGFAIV